MDVVKVREKYLKLRFRWSRVRSKSAADLNYNFNLSPPRIRLRTVKQAPKIPEELDLK
jgi:hypothetical protein